ncbi:reverse transcriptase-like protein [Sphingomonas sp.]|uniref:reverse transcriptase-like protein n=1 Tax=Sphingomonas sp. TaxID=28214 RepID=UPI00286C8AB7|nr:reverse transcriptase-like protein [Sphingomonas sp.]
MPAGVKVYFDGGCRSGPVGMETAVVVRGRCRLQRDLGPGTSLDAEWLALICAVEVACELELGNPLFLGDSLVVVGQANGRLKCRRASVRHLRALEALAPSFAPLRIRHVKRTQNLAGIALARLHPR